MKIERSYVTVMLISGALAGLVGVLAGARHPARGDPGRRRRVRLRRDHRRAARPRHADRHRARRAAVRRVPRRRRGDLAADTNTPPDVVSVIEPVIVLFIAAPALIRGIFRLRGPRRRQRRRPAGEGVERMSTRRSGAAGTHDRLSGRGARRHPRRRRAAGLAAQAAAARRRADRHRHGDLPGLGHRRRQRRRRVPGLAGRSTSTRSRSCGSPAAARPWSWASSSCRARRRPAGARLPTARMALGAVGVARCCSCSRSCAGRPPATRPTRSSLTGLVQQTRSSSSIPFILGALAGIVCERSGVINVAIEGQMLRRRVRRRAVRLVGASNLGIGLVAAMLGGAADRRAARRVRDPLPGQPGRARRRAQRARARPDEPRLPLDHGRATRTPTTPARRCRRSRSRCSATSRSSARRCSTSTSSCYMTYALVDRRRHRAVPHPVGPAHPRRRRAPARPPTPSASRCAAPATAT